MKIFKLVMTCVVVVLLALSTILNVFILSILGIKDSDSFKQVLLAKELLDRYCSVTVPEDILITDRTPTVKPELDPIYQDKYVRITYMQYEEDSMGRKYKFLIENLSTESLTIVFDEVYVDGFKMKMSGLYCDNLDADSMVVECFSLYRYEWEEFTSFPKKAKFRVRLIDPDTFATIHETSGKLNFNL